jgi:hypothetical protein
VENNSDPASRLFPQAGKMWKALQLSTFVFALSTSNRLKKASSTKEIDQFPRFPQPLLLRIFLFFNLFNPENSESSTDLQQGIALPSWL